MHNITCILHALDDTQKIAETVAKSIRTDDIITLQGDLGAGKTSFTKFFISYLTGKKRDDIISPTFNLLQTYDYAQGTIFHYDLYRLENEDELYELGFEESLSNGICIIEWPEIASDFLPDTVIDIHIKLDYKSGSRSLLLQTTNDELIKSLDIAAKRNFND